MPESAWLVCRASSLGELGVVLAELSLCLYGQRLLGREREREKNRTTIPRARERNRQSRRMDERLRSPSRPAPPTSLLAVRVAASLPARYAGVGGGGDSAGSLLVPCPVPAFAESWMRTAEGEDPSPPCALASLSVSHPVPRVVCSTAACFSVCRWTVKREMGGLLVSLPRTELSECVGGVRREEEKLVHQCRGRDTTSRRTLSRQDKVRRPQRRAETRV